MVHDIDRRVETHHETKRRQAEADLSRRGIVELIKLLSLYIVVLTFFMCLGDGPDLGTVLMALSGHMVYATWYFVKRRRLDAAKTKLNLSAD